MNRKGFERERLWTSLVIFLEVIWNTKENHDKYQSEQPVLTTEHLPNIRMPSGLPLREDVDWIELAQNGPNDEVMW
jgi:hypothetical protein